MGKDGKKHANDPPDQLGALELIQDKDPDQRKGPMHANWNSK